MTTTSHTSPLLYENGKLLEKLNSLQREIEELRNADAKYDHKQEMEIKRLHGIEQHSASLRKALGDLLHPKDVNALSMARENAHKLLESRK